MSLGRLLFGFFRPSLKGFVGEKLVAIGAKLTLPSPTYARFHDVTLPTPDGTTQIDHLFVSRFGVFVVETKNMSGWIFGGERWTQTFPRRRKSKFQNPLRQNYRHVKAVEEALASLSLPADSVRSVIAFVGDAELKTPMPRNVTVGFGFARYVKSFAEPMLSDKQVKAVCGVIEAGRSSPSWSTNREHVRALRSRDDPTAARKCRGCGKDMVLRTTSRGPNAGRRFWGCSGFPSCRTMQDVT